MVPQALARIRVHGSNRLHEVAYQNIKRGYQSENINNDNNDNNDNKYNLVISMISHQ